MTPSTRLTPELRFTIRELAQVDSTNAYALRRAHTLPHGAVIVADRQLAGRGRSGRSWYSPPGNLYMTILLKDPPHVIARSGPGWLTLGMAVAVCRALEGRGLSPQIKWPNDVLLNGGKVAGILAEGTWQDGRLVLMAVGLGVNLNMSREEADRIDRPVCVVSHVLGAPVDRAAFAGDVLDAFAGLLGRLDAAGPDQIKSLVLERACFLGTRVCVDGPRGRLSGQAIGLDERGGLLVVDDEQVQHTVVSGDVTCW